MRSVISALPFVSALALALALCLPLAGCDGCRGDQGPSAEERNKTLASAMATPMPSVGRGAVDSIGHAANVLPGVGPKRVESSTPRMGIPLPILPGQGIGPIRFGATKQTIERLMGAPCDDATETLCRYVGRAVDFKLEAGAVKEIRISRKGREAKRAADGSIVEYGFYNGAILPDLYFGMQPGALQEYLGAPQKVEKVTPMGADGFSERHFYDGMTLEYDLWSNGKLVLGAALLTKSDSAAANTEKLVDELAKRAAEKAKLAAKSQPTKVPR
jgi:hypothetical protein